MAQVERMEHMVHTEHLPDGSVWRVSNLVWFGIVAPQRFDTMLAVTTTGHPHIDGRPLLLGDTLSFILPLNWRNRDLSISDLEEVQFAE